MTLALLRPGLAALEKKANRSEEYFCRGEPGRRRTGSGAPEERRAWRRRVSLGCLEALAGVSGSGRLCPVCLHFVGPAEQRGAAAAGAAQAGSGGRRGPSHGRVGGAAAAAG